MSTIGEDTLAAVTDVVGDTFGDPMMELPQEPAGAGTGWRWTGRQGVLLLVALLAIILALLWWRRRRLLQRPVVAAAAAKSEDKAA